mgnify:CR=1 FL=1
MIQTPATATATATATPTPSAPHQRASTVACTDPYAVQQLVLEPEIQRLLRPVEQPVFESAVFVRRKLVRRTSSCRRSQLTRPQLFHQRQRDLLVRPELVLSRSGGLFFPQPGVGRLRRERRLVCFFLDRSFARRAVLTRVAGTRPPTTPTDR